VQGKFKSKGLGFEMGCVDLSAMSHTVTRQSRQHAWCKGAPINQALIAIG